MSIKVRNAHLDELEIESLTRSDITNLLLAYSGALALDQIRVDSLPPESFHEEYDRRMWQRYRKTHLKFIVLLLDTIPQMSDQMLEDLTRLAATANERIARRVMIDLLSRGATGDAPPGYIDSAPLFFDALIEDVDRENRATAICEDPRACLMDWLKPIDPLSISKDPECQYKL